jgi:hypothetical protein
MSVLSRYRTSLLFIATFLSMEAVCLLRPAVVRGGCGESHVPAVQLEHVGSRELVTWLNRTAEPAPVPPARGHQCHGPFCSPSHAPTNRPNRPSPRASQETWADLALRPASVCPARSAAFHELTLHPILGPTRSIFHPPRWLA